MHNEIVIDSSETQNSIKEKISINMMKIYLN